MRKVVIVITSLFLFLIDQTVIPFFAISGSYASVLFTFFALFSLMSDYEDAVLIGLVSGLLQDLYFPYGFGVHTLLNLMLFLGLSRLGKTLKEGKKALPLLIVALAQTLKTVILIAIFSILGISVNLTSVMIIPMYSIILSLLLYKAVYNFERIPVIKKEWKF